MSDDLLREVADIHPWRDESGINVCAFCDSSWSHKPDCLWVRIQRHLGRAVP